MSREGGGRPRVLCLAAADDPLLDGGDGVEVLTSADLDEALDRLAETPVDCVVSGHRPPAVDGVAVLEAVRESYPDLPVVLAPADGDEALAARAIDAGVTAYVPADERGRLPERVREAIADGDVRNGSRQPIRNLGMAAELRLKERAMDEAPVGITIADATHPDDALIYVNDAFERLTGYPVGETLGRNCRFLQGEGTDAAAVTTIREAIEAERPCSVELINYRADGEEFWNELNIAPVRDGDGEVTHYVGFQADVTDRKEAEFEVRRERRTLEHLLDRINGLVGDVTQEIVGATSREEVEAAACKRLVAVDRYAFAWIGATNVGESVVSLRRWAGEWTVTEEGATVALDDDHPLGGPIARAIESREVQVVEGTMAAPGWVDAEDCAGLAVVPLAYRETTYGVLVVHAARPEAFDERETAVLGALGRAIATALNAFESRRILSADNVVEVEFEVRDAGLFFVDLSRKVDARLEFKGSVYREDDPSLLFFSAPVDPARMLELADETPAVVEARVIAEQEEGTLFEFAVEEPSIVTELAERGARTRGITAEDGIARIRVELPGEADVRSIVEEFEERYPGTELVAYRERERPPTTKREFIGELEDRLTERQLTALRKAYVSGFYEWNRPTSGDELAASMGISRSTFHQHLRAAERKLVEEFFER